MTFQKIAIRDLVVNPANDRHGETPSESDAISWLLENQEDQMKALAKDIVDEGRLYEHPLVSQQNGKYLVFDGNRRITCLKLLKEPHRSPDDKWRKFFATLVADAERTLPDEIECEIENTTDVIDEILYRRHTGSQGGVGQSDWNDRAKANFINRTGKKKKASVAAEIEKFLKDENELSSGKLLPLSNLDRLLSNQRLQQRLGIVLGENGLVLTHEKAAVLGALKRVVSDLTNQKVILVDLWKNSTKEQYLDRLQIEGVLPTTEQALPVEKVVPKLPVPKRGSPGPRPKPKSYNPSSRDTLIPRSLEVAFPPNATRLQAIWYELQFDLVFSKSPNAIAVLFRVLLELSIDYCVAVESLASVHQNDHLHNKVRKVAEHFEKNKRIDSKYLAQMKKFGQDDVLISSSSMNAYVHSANFSPSPDHLRAIWDGMQLFLLECLRN